MTTPAIHRCDQATQLAALLENDDVDAAIAAGLMDFVACADCNARSTGIVIAAQQRLSTAWAARERFRAREARLARIAAERAARRAPPPQAQSQLQKPALPPAAALALARAKAKATQRNDQ
ncbi:MAG: hypothetical protein QM769_08740 [Pseudoxanthomonas sp.]